MQHRDTLSRSCAASLQQSQDRRRTASHLSRVKALMLEDSVPVRLFDDKLRNLTTRGSRRNSHRHNPSDACVTLRRLGLGAELHQHQCNKAVTHVRRLSALMPSGMVPFSLFDARYKCLRTGVTQGTHGSHCNGDQWRMHSRTGVGREYSRQLCQSGEGVRNGTCQLIAVQGQHTAQSPEGKGCGFGLQPLRQP